MIGSNIFYATPETVISLIKVLTLGASAFILAFLLANPLIKSLYKYKLWRKEVRKEALGGGNLPVFQKFHSQGEIQIPRFGGILVLATPLILASLFYIFSRSDIWFFQKLNFLSRSQTWLPLFALGTAALVGLADDFLQVLGKGKHDGGGLNLRHRLLLMAFIGLAGGWWFFEKLGWSTIHIPGNGDIYIGSLYIPFFVLVTMATYSGGVIDGLDGLAGGAFAFIFGAFSAIALFLGQVDIAAFSAIIFGTLLAFLWFNIPPAKFYMGETGIMGLTSALTVIAFLTDSVVVLPIIGILLVAESWSVITQLLSKKIRKKKILMAAPLHLHLEAKGWPHYQITMRFWIIGIIAAVIGVSIRLLG
ncbi:MAG: hypothetical protein HYW70_01315 [Candidatus Nealsonbacteria bacterium]|nr:hypothetical protein [Candidatus Nealsonbacteria bacterium]